MGRPIKEDSGGGDQEDREDDEKNHRGVEVERSRGGEKVVDSAAKEKFEQEGNRSIGEADEGEVGEMEQLQNEGKGDEKIENPAGGDPLEEKGEEGEDGDLEKSLPDRVDEEEKRNAGKGGGSIQEVVEGQEDRKKKDQAEIEVIKFFLVWFFAPPPVEPSLFHPINLKEWGRNPQGVCLLDIM